MPRITKLNKSFSIEDYSKLCNKILITMECGGLGDVLIHRMIFEDIKNIMPDCYVIFACQEKYIDAVSDHPHIDEVVDFKKINYDNYIIRYDTGLVCTRAETKAAPFSTEHRSDLIANYIGLQLNNHNMHLTLNENNVCQAKNKLKNDRPNFVLCPYSAISSKNITFEHIESIKNKIDQIGGFLYCVHHKNCENLNKLNIPIWTNLSISEWMASISVADYVISVDTAAFHLAGGLKKPLLGIFSFTDGKVYGKYFDFTLVQKHRDDGNWSCGPCYNWTVCPKSNKTQKPCITELSCEDITNGIDKMMRKTLVTSDI